MKPWDQINGETLDDNWPATAGQTLPMSNSPDTTKWDAHYNGVTFIAYTLSRPKGERAPIHYHEVPQQICLAKGKVLVKLEGSADKIYTAPDCYLMPAYTKMSVISLEDKVENCLFRVPDGGLDWVVSSRIITGFKVNGKTSRSQKRRRPKLPSLGWDTTARFRITHALTHNALSRQAKRIFASLRAGKRALAIRSRPPIVCPPSAAL